MCLAYCTTPRAPGRGRPDIDPGTQYEGPRHAARLHVATFFRVKNVRVQGTFDIINALHANPILAVNHTYGPSWRNVHQILDGRLLEFGARVDL